MRFAFVHWKALAGDYATYDKVDRVFEKIRDTQLHCRLHWVLTETDLNEFAPEMMFIQEAPPSVKYPDWLLNYPCDREFLKNDAA